MACTTNLGIGEKTTTSVPLTACTARAVVLVFGGIYLIRAVFQAEPYRAKGFEGILASLMRLPHGDWLLGFVALGFGAYGLSTIHAGFYRRQPY